MNELKKRGAKTESLSLRIDPKTKFVLEFLVRIKGFRITDVIERAIREYAEHASVGSEFDGKRTWIHYWHPDEGVRTINLIMDYDIETSFDEDELKDFLRQHPEFFFSDRSNLKEPIVAFVQVLWPHIEEYLEHWRNNKSSDRWGTGRLMQKAIKAANMQGPEWPRGAAKASPAPAKATFTSNGMDDEIPF